MTRRRSPVRVESNRRRRCVLRFRGRRSAPDVGRVLECSAGRAPEGVSDAQDYPGLDRCVSRASLSRFGNHTRLCGCGNPKSRKQYEAAYNAGDAEAIAAIYAVDGTHTYVFGVTHRGRVEIAKGLKEQFAGPVKGSRMEITPLHIRELTPGIAVEEASFSISGLKDGSGADLPSVGGLCLAVYQKDGAQWFAAAVQCMVPPRAP